MAKNTSSAFYAISPIDGRYADRTHVLSAYFSEAALLKMRVFVETHYLIALSEAGVLRKLSKKEKVYLLQLYKLTDQQLGRLKEYESVTHHDVKALEKLLRELLFTTSLKDILEMLHFGLTSEDVNNLSYRLLFKKALREVFISQIQKVIDNLSQKAKKYKALPMLARTHGQAAVPTTLGKELVNFAVRLKKEIKKLETLTFEGKLNGAVGNFNALVFVEPKKDWIVFSQKFIESLSLSSNLFTTQINTPEDIIELLQIFTRINGILLDLDQDMWRYSSDGWLAQEVRLGEIGSSTMPQKVNPIHFENSEGNIKIGNALLDGIIHGLSTSRLQRDLSGSTIMRNVGSALTYSFLALDSSLVGLERISADENEITRALNKNWAILTEAVQTILRNEKVTDAYMVVASLSRGKELSESQWKEWVKSLPVDEKIKQKLLSLTPEAYLGNAEKLTEVALLTLT